ncbi:MAG: hypothetical protein JWN87_848 [Frankiales bacterium]|nr:hypothetical protein [Frankiales bacterium]
MRRTPVVLAAVAALALSLANPQTAPAAATPPTFGLEFSASLPADVQRDEGEPEISIDPGGNIYTCGPSGFSNVADYAQVSRDGGDQFHLLGAPPRGQISTGEGGGDCGLASAPVKNQLGQYTWAYTGLGPLLNFSTGTADDTGRTLHGGAISQSLPGVDRQWMVFTDAKTVFLNYNGLAEGFSVQKSTDGGYSYGPRKVVSTTGGRIGPMRAILNGTPAKAKVYFPYDDGKKIKLAFSPDNGETWGNCTVGDAGISPTAGFVVADHDKAGNIYVTYAEKGGKDRQDTYVMVVRAKDTARCKTDTTVVGDGRTIRINQGKVETTVMPWIVASGAPGRFAVAYYGTEKVGDPNLGTFKAAWHVYVSMTLDGLAGTPKVGQVRASSHPTHYDSICLNGTLCDVQMGDRSLVDYFAMDLNPKDGRLNIVYNNAAKRPGEVEGHVANPVVMTQMAGPSTLGSTLKPKRSRVRQTSSDPAGDALSPYGSLCATPPAVPCPAPNTVNQPAMDFTDRGSRPAVEVTPELDLATGKPVRDGGFTVTLRLKSLSRGDKQAAASSAGGTSLIYLFRWINGYQPAGVTARWSPVTGWSYAFDSYTTASTQSGQADPTAEKIVVFPGSTPIAGDVVEDGPGVIRMSVPRRLLKALGKADANGRPSEVAATNGALLPSAVAYALVNIAPDARVQSYLYPVDNAPAMDFRLGAKAGSVRASAAVGAVALPVFALGLWRARRQRRA